MSSSLRRGALAAAATAFSIAALSACAAGTDAQTLEVKPDNAETAVGDIKIQNAIVITQPVTDSPGPAVVSATLFNTGSTPRPWTRSASRATAARRSRPPRARAS